MTHVVYASSNPGKLGEIRTHLNPLGISVDTMEWLGAAAIDVEETGTTLGENAILKARAYAGELALVRALQGTRVVVLSDDTGLFIDGLKGEPGIHVRRWKDGQTRMSDEEIIDYLLGRMRHLKGDAARVAHFKTVIAACVLESGGEIREPELFTGELRGTILEAPFSPDLVKGFPLTWLFRAEDYQLLLGHIYAASPEEKKGYLTHRERALGATLPFLREQLAK